MLDYGEDSDLMRAEPSLQRIQSSFIDTLHLPMCLGPPVTENKARQVNYAFSRKINHLIVCA